MKVRVGSFALPTGAGGTQAVDLSATFSAGEPLRAVKFFAGKNTADGAVDPAGGTAQYGIGYATNDGGTIQQGYVAHGDVDAAANADLSCGSGTGAALKGFANGSAGIDYEMDVTTFTNTGFTVTSVDPPPTAIIVCYIAFGGADVTGARVFAFNTAAGATQNVTVAAGFGQPAYLEFATAMKATGDAAASGGIGLGVASSPTSRRFLGYSSQDTAATMNTGQWQGNRALVVINPATPVVDGEADLSAVGSWPADGFQLTWADQATLTHEVICLALKGTFTVSIGSGASPLAVAPVTQTLTGSGQAPRGVFMMGWPLNTQAGVRTADANLSALNLGASDFTNHRTNGLTQDDAATTSIVSTYLHTSRLFEVRTLGAAAALQAYAGSAAANGTDVDITWPDTDAGTAREYSYVVFADAAAGGTAWDPGTIGDALGVTDAIAISLTESVSDALGVTDNAATVAALVRQIDDALGVTDAATPVVGRVAAVNDALGITDQATPAPGRAVAVDDALGIVDAVALARELVAADALGVTDAQAFARGLVSADALALTDAAATVAAYNAAVSDALGVTDQAAAAIVLLAAVNDALGITDQRSFVVGPTIGDALGVTDNAALVRTVAAAIADNLGVTDAQAFAIAAVLADPLGVTDQAAAAIVLLAAVNDNLGVTDAAAAAQGRTLALSDALGITDQASRLSSLGLVLADPLDVVDALATASGYSRDLADLLAIADVVNAVRGAAGAGPPVGHRAGGGPGHRGALPPGHRAGGGPGHRGGTSAGGRTIGPPGHREQ